MLLLETSGQHWVPDHVFRGFILVYSKVYILPVIPIQTVYIAWYIYITLSTSSTRVNFKLHNQKWFINIFPLLGNQSSYQLEPYNDEFKEENELKPYDENDSESKVTY